MRIYLNARPAGRAQPQGTTGCPMQAGAGEAGVMLLSGWIPATGWVMALWGKGGRGVRL